MQTSLVSMPSVARDVESADELLELSRGMEAFFAKLRPEALASGVRADVFDRSIGGLQPDLSIPPLLTNQPELVSTPWDYMNKLVSENRIATGRQLIAEHAAVLAAIEAEHGVDRHVVIAIWGIESNFGALPGTRPVVRSLATLAASDLRRSAFWKAELIAALKIIGRGDIAPEAMTGSWAGAMGHTQFMPSSYIKHAVDHDRDGRRDIWGSVPDALASTASYLKWWGWKLKEPWGLEVLLPAGFDYAHADPNVGRDLSAWRVLGVALPPGREWPAALPGASLLLPAGMRGPAFLVGNNFKSILRYNNATAYALAVGHLADRLAGREALAGRWPTDDPPLDRAGRVELQQRLVAHGLDVGGVDGVIGGATRNAVRAWQRRHGLPEDGWPSTKLLGLMREASATVR